MAVLCAHVTVAARSAELIAAAIELEEHWPRCACSGALAVVKVRPRAKGVERAFRLSEVAPAISVTTSVGAWVELVGQQVSSDQAQPICCSPVLATAVVVAGGGTLARACRARP